MQGSSSQQTRRAAGALRGFTVIELLVVMAVLAILASIVAPRFAARVDQSREVTLRHNLIGLRTALDQFHRDKGRYPNALEELVSERYIRAVPVDPITERTDTWVLVPSSQGPGAGASARSPSGVFDVRSGAQGQSSDGSSYGTW